MLYLWVFVTYLDNLADIPVRARSFTRAPDSVFDVFVHMLIWVERFIEVNATQLFDIL
jgi:hypothetical protein